MYILVTYIYTLLCIITSKKKKKSKQVLFNLIDLVKKYLCSGPGYDKNSLGINLISFLVCELSGLTFAILSEHSN